MKKIILFAILLGATSLFSQKEDAILIKEIPIIKNNMFLQRQEIDALTKTINDQQYAINQQKNTIDALSSQSIKQEKIIDSLSQLIKTNSDSIVNNSKELETKIEETGQKTSAEISELDSNVNKNFLYWIIATLGMLLLGGLTYLFLGKRINSSKIDVEAQIKNTKKSLEEEGVKLDNKLIEILETQLKLKQEENKKNETPSSEEADHSLALKVADEIIRIQKNLSRMDEGTKGLKQLNSSVTRIQDNFAASGYELVEMIGKEYDEGMKVVANFTPSEDLKTGEQIITRIIKPQVNFNGKMIQAAQIEVSVGE